MTTPETDVRTLGHAELANRQSLLLFIEASWVDYGGQLHSRRLNDDDWVLLCKWENEKKLEFGRIAAEYVNNTDWTHWVKPTHDLLIEAQVERLKRGQHLWETRSWMNAEEHQGS